MSWPVVKLSEVCTLINGRAYKQHELLAQGKYTVLRVGNFFSNRDWYYSDLELPDDKYCAHGDLLYAWSASFGPRIWEGEKVIYHYHIWKIVIDEKLVDKKYLFYALQNDIENIKREQGTGSTMIHVTKAAMEERRLPLPPLPEQKRIAAILDKADAIRRKRQQAIQLADDFLRAVFLEMFGDPVSNPKGLPVVPLIELCSKVTDGTHQSPKWEEKGIPFLFISNIVNGKINYDTDKFISEETLKELTRSTPIEKGDILYTTVGSYGNVALVPGDSKFCFQRHIAHIKPNHKIVKPLFLANMLGSSAIRRQADGLVRGVAQKTLNLSALKEIKVFRVSGDAQENYLKTIEPLKRIKENLEISESNLNNKFISLSQKAFSGQL